MFCYVPYFGALSFYVYLAYYMYAMLCLCLVVYVLLWCIACAIDQFIIGLYIDCVSMLYDVCVLLCVLVVAMSFSLSLACYMHFMLF